MSSMAIIHSYGVRHKHIWEVYRYKESKQSYQNKKKNNLRRKRKKGHVRCKECGVFLLGKNLKKHLRKVHHNGTVKVSKRHIKTAHRSGPVVRLRKKNNQGCANQLS